MAFGLFKSKSPIRVVIIDDDRLLTDAISRLLQMKAEETHIEVVGVAHSPEEAWPLLEKTQPDVALVDIRLRKQRSNDRDGLELTAAIHQKYPDMHILLITAQAYSVELIREAVRAGAIGLQEKQDLDWDKLVQRIQMAAEGVTIFDPEDLARIVPKVADQLSPEVDELYRKYQQLSEREQEACRLIAKGLSNKEIARMLGIAENTAGRHVSNICTKLGYSRHRLIALISKHEDVFFPPTG